MLQCSPNTCKISHNLQELRQHENLATKLDTIETDSLLIKVVPGLTKCTKINQNIFLSLPRFEISNENIIKSSY